MKKIVWNMDYLSSPPAIRHCSQCGRKTEFYCSGQFRINAQRKYLDIWLIYRCATCGSTWNGAIHSRISPRMLSPEQLDRFHRNDDALVRQYSMDIGFLHGNGAEAGQPAYRIEGEVFRIGESVELKIKSEFPAPIKVSAVLRSKLRLTRKAYSELIDGGGIRSVPEQDLRKCRLNEGITLVFDDEKGVSQ